MERGNFINLWFWYHTADFGAKYVHHIFVFPSTHNQPNVSSEITESRRFNDCYYFAEKAVRAHRWSIHFQHWPTRYSRANHGRSHRKILKPNLTSLMHRPSVMAERLVLRRTSYRGFEVINRANSVATFDFSWKFSSQFQSLPEDVSFLTEHLSQTCQTPSVRIYHITNFTYRYVASSQTQQQRSVRRNSPSHVLLMPILFRISSVFRWEPHTYHITIWPTGIVAKNRCNFRMFKE